MHEVLEVLGHVMRFGVSVAAFGCGVAAVARCHLHPKSIPLAVGFAAFGFGDLVMLVFQILGFYGGSYMRYAISAYFILASLAILVGIKLIGDCYREGADAN